MKNMERVFHHFVLSSSPSRKEGHVDIAIVTVPHSDVLSLDALKLSIARSRRSAENQNPILANAWASVARAISDPKTWSKEEYPVDRLTVPAANAPHVFLDELSLGQVGALRRLHAASNKPAVRVVSAFDPEAPVRRKPNR